MGADGHIAIIRVSDREWYENGGYNELRNFVENFYKRNLPNKEPYAFNPYFYKNFLNEKGTDVLIIYYGDYHADWYDVGLEAIESKEFEKRFKGKLKYIGKYEVWT